MICKYNYNNKWYSEDELKNLIGEEFFEKENLELKEFSEDKGVLIPIERNMALYDIFKDSTEQLVTAQETLMSRMGELIYIGDLDAEYAEKLIKNTRNGKSIFGSTKKREFYIPEKFDVAIQQAHEDTINFLKLIEGYMEKGAELPESVMDRYNAMSKLKSFDNFKEFVGIIYPEAANVGSTAKKQILTEDDEIQTVGVDIQDNIKRDMEKGQSKYVKFVTNFIEYKVIEDGKEIFKIINDPRFSYHGMLETLSGSFDSEYLIQELTAGFEKIVNTDPDLDISKLSAKQKKYRGIFEKLRNLVESQFQLSAENNDHPIFRTMRFETEDTFIYDTTFQTKIHNVRNAETPYGTIVNKEGKEAIRKIERLKTNKGIEDSYSFLSRLVDDINKELRKRPGHRKNQEVTITQMSHVWTYAYNRNIIREVFSLFNSQRNSNPVMASTNGKTGEITVVNKPITRTTHAHDLRNVFKNDLNLFFPNKESIVEFKTTIDYKDMYEDITSEEVSGNLRGIEKFVKFFFNKKKSITIFEDDKDIRNLSSQIKYFLDALDSVNATQARLDRIAKGINLDEILEDGNDVFAEDVIRKNANTLINTISDFYDEGGDRVQRSMGTSANGTGFYIYHLSSYIENLHDFITDSTMFYPIDKGRSKQTARKSKPELLDTSLQHNPIIRRLIKIGKLYLYRGNQYYSYPIMYDRERTNDWFIREFSSGFLTEVLSSESNELSYDYYYPPISNKPNAKMVKISVSGREENYTNIKAILDTIKDRPERLNGLIQNYNSKDTLLFRVLDGEDINDPLIVEKLYEKILTLSVQSAKEFVLGNELHISQNIRAVESRLRNNDKLDNVHNEMLLKVLKKEGVLESSAKGIVKSERFSFGTKTKNEDNTETKEYNNKVTEFIEVYSLFYLNTYINTFVVNQITVGDPAFLKHENDFIKRLSIAFSPGSGLFVEQLFSQGANREFKMAVFKEYTEDAAKEMAEVFDYLLDDAVTDEEKTFLVSMFENFDRSDAQGFMLESRLEDIQAGQGSSFSQGTAVKPVIYTKRKMLVKTKKGVEEYWIPTAVKYASFSLSDKLMTQVDSEGTYKFPKMVKLMKWMKANELQEVVFQSGVKIGSAHTDYLYGLDDVLNLDENSPEFNSAGLDSYDADTEASLLRKIDKTKDENELKSLNTQLRSNRVKLSTMTISNKDYRIQQNPNSDGEFNKHLHTPSQLVYVMNMAANSANEPVVSDIYESFANIMDLQGSRLKNDLSQKQVSPAYFNEVIAKKMKGQGNEAYAQYVTEGVDVNFPALLQKGTIQFASFISSEILSTKFPGGKFQLVSDSIFTNRGKELKLKR